MATLKVPGRIELSGNHTDHQLGRVLGSAIHLNVQADYAANSDATIRMHSADYDPIAFRTNQLSVRPAEFGKPISLVRGVAAAFRDLGLNIGGFDATVSSSLPIGAGLSSSAAFSVLIARILNNLYNDGKVEDIVLARAAHTAENVHFGKPCGITSQLVCVTGHTLYLDLKENIVERITADFSEMGLTMCLTDTGGSHDGLNTSYARIPADMSYIANLFDCGVLAEVDPEDFRSRGWDLSNRPVRRAMHFFDENERVPRMRDADEGGRGRRLRQSQRHPLDWDDGGARRGDWLPRRRRCQLGQGALAKRGVSGRSRDIGHEEAHQEGEPDHPRPGRRAER